MQNRKPLLELLLPHKEVLSILNAQAKRCEIHTDAEAPPPPQKKRFTPPH